MISVIGTGPGSMDQMTGRAIKAIKKSNVVVGYGKYIELIAGLLDEKEVMSTGMKGEVERCRYAVEMGVQGKDVAVISSGDAGVYGMAGLIYELAEGYPQLEIEVIPGITAANASAAVLGAPLMNDFAVISLSDLLTPWDIIEKRVRAAAMGDFVIALYNPSSKKRADYLNKVCSYILEYRQKDAWCGFVRNISRDGERYEICTLEELKDKTVDMFTTIIVGNSKTKVINNKLITPRGYHYD